MFKKFVLFLNSFLLFIDTASQADIPVCTNHIEEIKDIRLKAAGSMAEGHKLTGEIIGSIVVTSYDLAWNEVRDKKTYTEFSNSFQGLINYCNKKGNLRVSATIQWI